MAQPRILAGSLALALSTLALAPRASAQDFAVDQLLQQANDLAWDPFSGLLFASVPSAVGPGGNSVVPIDPVGLGVGQPIPAGSEPGKLAMSDDGEYLYVGLAGAAAVRRVHVPSLSPDILIQLGNGTFGPRYAEDLPSSPATRPCSPCRASGLESARVTTASRCSRTPPSAPTTHPPTPVRT